LIIPRSFKERHSHADTAARGGGIAMRFSLESTHGPLFDPVRHAGIALIARFLLSTNFDQALRAPRVAPHPSTLGWSMIVSG